MSKSLKNTLPVKICWEKACNYMKWRVAKTSKLKLLLAKAHTHTSLPNSGNYFQEFDFQQMQALPPLFF